MALTPEDVIKKSFSATHLRRGYDETQVDDFLDEVVVELRRLTAENEDLRTQLADCRASKGLDGEGAVAPSGTLDEQQLAQVRKERELVAAELTELEERAARAREEADAVEADARERIEKARAELTEAEDATRARLEGELRELRERVDTARVEAEGAEQELAALRAQVETARGQAARADEEQAAARHTSGPADVVTSGAAGGASASSVDESARIISLAERLHDEHVQEGETTKARLISEGEEYRDRTVSEADQMATQLLESGQSQHDELVRTGQERHDELVRTGQERHDTLIAEAEEERSTILSDLESKRGAINAQITELTRFEQDYRSRMREFITEQLDILDRDGDGVSNAQPEG